MEERTQIPYATNKAAVLTQENTGISKFANTGFGLYKIVT
jgi:hypothetical protein